MIKINDYPQLKLISWNIHADNINEQDALDLYELNWRYVDQENLTTAESNLIQRLVTQNGNGVLNV